MSEVHAANASMLARLEHLNKSRSVSDVRAVKGLISTKEVQLERTKIFREDSMVMWFRCSRLVQ